MNIDCQECGTVLPEKPFISPPDKKSVFSSIEWNVKKLICWGKIIVKLLFLIFTNN